jgi:hypothetical protein
MEEIGRIKNKDDINLIELGDGKREKWKKKTTQVPKYHYDIKFSYLVVQPQSTNYMFPLNITHFTIPMKHLMLFFLLYT